MKRKPQEKARIKVLNLFAGLGGNRKLWKDCEVTAVESNKEIADVYQRLYPQDTVIVGDAHSYLSTNAMDYDFIWSSPPCQTHSRMNKATRHENKSYPDMKLYEEIIFLQHFLKDKKWVVENVSPYYEPLIPAKQVGRHLFWTNFQFEAQDVDRLAGFITMSNLAGKKALQDWLGIHFEENIYYGNNHCPAQVLRNCVHPELGLQVFQAAIDYHKPEQFSLA